MRNFPLILIIESVLLLLAISYASLLLGRIRKGKGRWQQGYDMGQRVGWYDAADELRETLALPESPDFRRGWSAAHMHLETYWDKLDKGTETRRSR